jgi:hypothetical protein
MIDQLSDMPAMVPGEFALFSLDELERAKEWAAG